MTSADQASAHQAPADQASEDQASVDDQKLIEALEGKCCEKFFLIQISFLLIFLYVQANGQSVWPIVVGNIHPRDYVQLVVINLR